MRFEKIRFGLVRMSSSGFGDWVTRVGFHLSKKSIVDGMIDFYIIAMSPAAVTFQHHGAFHGGVEVGGS